MEELSENNQSTNGSPESNSIESSSLNEIEVHSAEVQEIIGKPPHWLVRWGITAFLGVLIIIFLSAWTIEYPEVIKTPLRLTAINAPKTLETEIDGKLIKLLSNNNSVVHEGEILAWLQSMASHQQVLDLSAKIGSMQKWLENNDPQKFKINQISGFSDLGELQGRFQTFEQSFRVFLSYLPGGFYSKKRNNLRKELKFTQKLRKEMEERKQIQEKSHELTQQQYNAQKTLVDNNLIPRLEFVQEEKNLLSSRLSLQQYQSSVINNELSQLAKRDQIRELDKKIAEQKAIFKQALNTFRSSIEEWKSKYLIITPISGKLIYAGFLQENQSLRAGEKVFYIQPDNTKFFGEMPVSQNSLGKIKEGQEVMVSFSSYPASEFGTVSGELEYLSDVPVQDTVFLGKVSFPQNLTTNYGRKITPRNGMTGTAEIITQDMKLLERIYNNITRQIR